MNDAFCRVRALLSLGAMVAFKTSGAMLMTLTSPVVPAPARLRRQGEMQAQMSTP